MAHPIQHAKSSVKKFGGTWEEYIHIHNWFDETSGECHKAMDKILELYKENEHGTELVKDIEKVLNLQTRDDEQTPSARAKEYLKQCVNIVKGN